VKVSDRVLAYLDANPEQSFTARVIGAAIGVSSGSVAMACRYLHAHRKIEARPGPRRLYQAKH